MKKYIIDFPNLLKEWDYDKNVFLPNKITYGSSKKVWWICSKCGNQWEATPKNRVRGTGCPICSLSKIKKNRNKTLLKEKGSLLDNRPDLAKEWDYDKNKNLNPKDVTCGSGMKVWWKCEFGHSWKAKINNRVSGSNCIYCTKQKPILGINDLKTTHPNLVKEWDYDKNNGLLPENFMAGSNVTVWWKCELGHSWKTAINHRTNGTRCPKCFKDYGTSFAEQAICYYLSRVTVVKNREKINSMEVDIYLPNYKIGFEYDGKYYHNSDKSKLKEVSKDYAILKKGINLYHIKESNKNLFDTKNKIIYCKVNRDYTYIAEILKNIEKILKMDLGKINIIDDSINIYNSYISSIKKNSIFEKNKELIKEWDYNKNKGLSPKNFMVGSNVKVWWICSKCNSSYLASISHRVSGTGCTYCSGKKINETNNLKNKYPTISSNWDYKKNENLTPDNVYFRSRKKVWWICPNCKESFLAPICSRIKSKTLNCPKCMHKHIGNMNRKKSLEKGNSLYEKRPDLALEWNKEKNGILTPKDVTCGTGIKVWWKCLKCENEWQTTVYNRTNGTNCPKCYREKEVKKNE